MRQSLSAVGLIAAGLVAGVLLGRQMPASNDGAEHAARAPAHALHPDVPESAKARAQQALAADHGVVETVDDVQQLPGMFARSLATHAIAAGADADGLAQLIRDAQRIAEPAERRDALAILFKRYAGLDPQAAFAFAATLADDKDAWHARAAVMEPWARSDPYAAMDAAAALPGVARRNSLINVALVELLRRDPEEAIAAADTLPARRDGWLPIVYSLWAREDAEAALRHAATISDGEDQELAMRVAAHYWAQDDPSAAQAWLTAADKTQDRVLVMMVGAALARTSPEMAAQIARQLENTQSRNRLLGESVRNLVKTDPQRAVAHLEGLTGAERRMALSRIAHEWSKTDPHAALAWANTLPKKEADKTVVAIVNNWFESEPTLATQYVSGLSGTARNNAVAVISNRLARDDPAAAFEWLLRVDGGAINNRAVLDVASAWSRRDPAAAVRHFSNYQHEEWIKPPLNTSLQQFAARNGAQASLWVERLADPDIQQLAAESVARGWAKVDREATLAWAQTRPAAQRDRALTGILSTMGEEPEASVPIANAISDYYARDKAIVNVLQRIVRNDPGLARQIIKDAAISDTRRQQLLDHYGI